MEKRVKYVNLTVIYKNITSVLSTRLIRAKEESIIHIYVGGIVQVYVEVV